MSTITQEPAATLLINLSSGPAAPTLARRELDSYARELLSEDRLADARLLVTELVTNGVRHGWGDVRLHAVASDDTVHVEVVDEGDGFEPRRREFDRAGGWGLEIVDRLADRWGVFPGSTHVWFELDRPLSG